MKHERISLTAAPGGENHRGNQLVGVLPVLGNGLKPNDLFLMNEHMKELGYTTKLLNLKQIGGFDGNDQVPDASVLLIKNFANKKKPNNTLNIYKELISNEWDKKFLHQ